MTVLSCYTQIKEGQVAGMCPAGGKGPAPPPPEIEKQIKK